MPMTFDNDGPNYMAAATSLEGILGVIATFCVWIKTTQTGSNQIFNTANFCGVEQGGGVNDIFYGALDNMEHTRMGRGGGVAAESTTIISDDTWHFVVLTSNSTTGLVEVYVDGVLEDSQTSDTGIITTTFSDIARMTDTAGGADEFFGGTYDDVRIYDRILSAAEVTTLFATRGVDGIVDGLRNRWLMDEGPVGLAATISGQNKDAAQDQNNGTPTSSPVFAEGELRSRRRVA
jgi:hypothetical protein